MDMSKAAMPARYGRASKQDEQHPLFHVYQKYRSGMSRLMVDSQDFQSWLFNYETNLQNEKLSNHPEFPKFQKWMFDNQGGARKCPAGNFPHNFHFWLSGGRW